MQASSTLDRAFDALALQAFRVRGVGITRAEATLGVRGDRNVPGGIVVLRAEERLAHKIASAQPFAFPDEVIDAIGTMAQAVMPLVAMGQLHLTPSEPLMIALAHYLHGRRAGVVLDEGWYTVPRADTDWPPMTDLKSAQLSTELERQFYRLSAYTRILNFGTTTLPIKFEFFNPDNPAHRAWISFIVIPDRPLSEISDEQLAQCLRVADPGWNFLAGQEHTLPSLVATYREHLPLLGALKH